jgi:polyphosphate glucokinase
VTRIEHEILAFDVGGSYVKAGLVDVRQGVVLGDVVRRPTPPGALPEAVLDLLSEMADDLPAVMGPVGLAFPAVTKHGVAWTAANIDNRWIGMNAQGHLQARLQRPVAFLNDADAAGIAEMTLGAGAGHEGTVMMLTLGTGIGTAIFSDGKLLPNTELGHLEVQGREAEHRASARVRADRELDWDEWAEQLNLVLETYHALFWPDLFIVGGGVTENWHMFGPLLRSRAEIVPARFGNDAGIIGAAMAASQLAS